MDISEREFYHPERSSGTIQYYKNHKKIKDSLLNQGNFDISISVDFSRVYRIANYLNYNLCRIQRKNSF